MDEFLSEITDQRITIQCEGLRLLDGVKHNVNVLFDFILKLCVEIDCLDEPADRIAMRDELVR
jgi:hypothetical protein